MFQKSSFLELSVANGTINVNQTKSVQNLFNLNISNSEHPNQVWNSCFKCKMSCFEQFRRVSHSKQCCSKHQEFTITRIEIFKEKKSSLILAWNINLREQEYKEVLADSLCHLRMYCNFYSIFIRSFIHLFIHFL